MKSTAYFLHRLIATLDKNADKLLQAEFGISYRRALFLAVLQEAGPMTQHALAVELGYADPSASTMLAVLATDGYVKIALSEQHKRKHIVSITPKGSELVTKAQTYLDAQFSALVNDAGVDIDQYGKLTQRIYQTVIKNEKTRSHNPWQQAQSKKLNIRGDS